MVKDETIEIALATDDAYAQHCGVVIASTLINSDKKTKYHFYIIDDNISKKNKEKINELKKLKQCTIDFLKVDKTKFKNLPEWAYSMATYYRLSLPSLLPHLNKIIYLDSDVLALKDIKELWDVDIKNYALAGTIDKGVSDEKLKELEIKRGRYVNAGVIVINLKYWRENSIESKFLKYLTKNFKGGFPDQDAINLILKNKIKIIDQKWDVFAGSDDAFKIKPCIVHYINLHHKYVTKPWYFSSRTPYKKEYWDILKQTPWKDYKFPDKNLLGFLIKISFPIMPKFIYEIVAKLRTKLIKKRLFTK
jgi:lipopolysaccharide biosynthesis glycosyltransferase